MSGSTPAARCRSGPESAGASPGPVCYDMGGETPTITDANVLLGYINPAHLVGGALKLNAEKARAVFAEKIAKPLGMPIERAAYGAHLIAASNMIRAIKAVSTERGRDPREFALFAFGGNGPLFAAGMAAALGITRIVVPPSAGLFSSFGLLYADVEHHYARTFRRLLRQADLGEIAAAWDALAQQASEQLAAEGFTGERARLRRSAALHYKGQSYELDRAGAGRPDRCAHGRASRGGVRPRSTSGPTAIAPAPRSRSSWSRSSSSARACARAAACRRRVTSSRPRQHRAGRRGRPISATRTAGWRRRCWAAPISSVGRAGPLIVEEYDATCVVPPGARAELDAAGNIVIDVCRALTRTTRGSHITMSGQMQIMRDHDQQRDRRTAPSRARRRTSVPRPRMPWMTNRLMPKGGVIIAVWIRSTIRTPYHTGS